MNEKLQATRTSSNRLLIALGVLLAHSWVYICLSPLVGGIPCRAHLYSFRFGSAPGNLFPKFVPDASSNSIEGLAAIFQVHGDATEYAKLNFLVLCGRVF